MGWQPLGSGILGLEAGLKYMFTSRNMGTQVVYHLGIVAAFVLSAITGLLKDTLLAAFNIILFFALWLFLLCFVPLQETFHDGWGTKGLCNSFR